MPGQTSLKRAVRCRWGGRLRALSGAQNIEGAQLRRIPFPAGRYRCRFADPRSHRSQRAFAEAGAARFLPAGFSRRAGRSICAPTCCPTREASRKAKSRLSIGAMPSEGALPCRRSTPRPTHSHTRTRSRRLTMSSGSRSNRTSAPDTGMPAIFSVPPPSSLSFGEGHAGQPLRILASGDIGPDAKLFQTSPEAPTGFRLRHFGSHLRRSETALSGHSAMAARKPGGRNLSGADGGRRPPHPSVRGRAHPGANRRSHRSHATGQDFRRRRSFSIRPWPFARTEVFRQHASGTRPRYRYRGDSPLSESAFHRDRQRKQGDRKAFGNSTSSLPRAACKPAGSATISSVGSGIGKQRFC